MSDSASQWTTEFLSTVSLHRIEKYLVVPMYHSREQVAKTPAAVSGETGPHLSTYTGVVLAKRGTRGYIYIFGDVCIITVRPADEEAARICVHPPASPAGPEASRGTGRVKR
ncbi:hypothetical protein CBL_06190 [Carabus blaptoides fortunei]